MLSGQLPFCDLRKGRFQLLLLRGVATRSEGLNFSGFLSEAPKPVITKSVAQQVQFSKGNGLTQTGPKGPPHQEEEQS